LAGILVVVAYHMSEWRHFKDLLKSNRMDIIVLLTTFFLTVFFDLILAIEIGLILSSFIFMKRMSEATTINNAENLFGVAESNREKLFEEELPYIPKNTMLYEINGPLFFGASQKFQEFLTDLKQEPKVLILRMRNVPFIDATAVNRLKEFHQKLKSSGTTILISGANRQVKEELFKSEFYSLIGKNNILDSINQAIERAEKINNE
jgi:SulP family sulfate permease